MPRIQAPDGTLIDFPASMKDPEIVAAMGKLYPAPKTPAEPGILPAGNYGISAEPKPSGVAGNVEKFARDVGDDLRYGTDNTFIGRLAKSMGARGLYQGVSPKTAEFMGSPTLGTAQAVQGAGEMGQPGKRLTGAKDVALGALDAAQIPMSFAGGPGGQGTEIGTMIPTRKAAGAGLEAVTGAAGDQLVKLEGPMQAAMRAKQLADRGGGTLPAVIKKFLQRARGLTEGPAHAVEVPSGEVATEQVAPQAAVHVAHGDVAAPMLAPRGTATAELTQELSGKPATMTGGTGNVRSWRPVEPPSAPPAMTAPESWVPRSAPSQPNFKEMRDFYTAASKMSATERAAMTGPMKAATNQFAAELNKALTETAGRVGQAEKYAQSLREYHQAAAVRRLLADVVKSRVAKTAAGVGLGGAAAKYFNPSLLGIGGEKR